MQPYISLVFQFPEGLIFWFVFILIFIPETRFIKRTRHKKSSVDAGTFDLIRVWGQLALGISAIVSFLPWFVIPHAKYVFGFGILLLISGGILRQISFRSLGKYFRETVLIQDDHQVIQDGPYRWVRHPSYTGSLLAFIGIGLALGSWLSVIINVVTMSIVYAKRVKVEEKALCEKIGQPYYDYISRSKRFIPFVY